MPGQSPMVVDVPDERELRAEQRATARERGVTGAVTDCLLLLAAGLAAYTFAPAWVDFGALVTPVVVAGAAAAVLLYFVVRNPVFRVALLLAPVAFVISPAAADVLPHSHDYEIRQASVRYLSAVSSQDALAACRETSESQRRAIVAAGGDAFPASGSVAACATHSAEIISAYVAAYPLVAGEKLEIDRRGDAAVVSTRYADKLVTLGREGDTWKVDFLATARAKFMRDCAAGPTPGAEALCGCAWDAIRAHGVSTLTDLRRFNRQVLSRRTPAWVAQAVGGCAAG